jgi:hypothetical protein
MNLERTGPPPTTSEEEQETYWTCTMHPQVREKQPGNCPICGMKLVERTAVQPAMKVVLTCGMEGHPQFEPGTEPQDGKCPVCGMKLLEKDVTFVATEPGKCPLDGKPLVMTNEALSVPKTAVINTGERAVVYVDQGDAGYVPKEVVLGMEGWAEENGVRRRYFPILSGLHHGETIVTQGNFLIDSQSQITGTAAGAYGGAIGKEAGAEMPAGHRH